jgi:hypothetical protein
MHVGIMCMQFFARKILREGPLREPKHKRMANIILDLKKFSFEDMNSTQLALKNVQC